MHSVSIKRCLFAAALAVSAMLFISPPGAEAQGLSLQDCINMAGAMNSKVLISDDQSLVDQERMSAAWRRFFPKVDLDLYHQPKVDYFGRPLEDADVYTSEVKVTQPLYRSGAITGELAAAEQGFKRTRVMRSKALLEVSVQVTPLYFQALAATEIKELRQSLIVKARELVELSKKALQFGKLRKEDLLKAEAKLYEALYEVAQSESAARKAALQLKELIGLPRHRRLELRHQVPAFCPPKDPEKLIEDALPKNPLVSAAQSEALYQKLGLDVAQSEGGPSLNLVGRYGYEGDSWPGGDKFYGLALMYEMRFGDSSAKAFYDYEHQFENLVALYDRARDLHRKGLRFSFLDGNSTAKQLAEARLRRRQAHYELRETKMRVATELRTLMQDLRHSQALAQFAAKEMALAQERVSTASAKVKLGAATYAEVLERELDLAGSQARMINARYEQYRVLALLCLQSGRNLVLEDAPCPSTASR